MPSEERLARKEDPSQLVVVLLADGVVLVIVATRAGDGESKHALGDGVDLLVGHVEGELPAITFLVTLGTDRQVTGREKVIGRLRDVPYRKKIPGDLRAHEIVVRFVLVERFNDPVAVTPGVRIGNVVFLAAGLGVPGNIEPVPSPSFAERGRCKELLDDLRIGSLGAITHEGLDFLGGRGNPAQVEAQAPDEGRLVRIPHRSKGVFLELRQDERVDLVCSPPFVLDIGRGRSCDRLERPVIRTGFLGYTAARNNVFRKIDHGYRLHDARVGRATSHPILENQDLPIGKLALRWHLEVLVRPADGLDQEAAIGITGNDCGTRDPAHLPPLLGIQDESTTNALGVRGVASVAMLDEDRPDA